MSSSRMVPVFKVPGKPVAALVFYHGLGGDSQATWQREGQPGTYWPKWLAEDINGLSVYAFSYPAAQTQFQGHAMSLLQRADNALEHLLATPELDGVPLFFVCHSLGGLVVKQLIRRAAELADGRAEARDLVSRIWGVAFVATPHAGSSLASTLSLASRILRLSPSSLDLIKDDPRLLDLNTWYRNWAHSTNVPHLVFYETRAIYGITTVDNVSSDPGLPYRQPIALDADHIDICKPADKSELLYTRTLSFMKAILRERAQLSGRPSKEPAKRAPMSRPNINITQGNNGRAAGRDFYENIKGLDDEL